MYMDGAADELGGAASAMLRLFAPGVAAGGHAARALGMDDLVTIGNNLHPTSHADDWSRVDIPAMTKVLIDAFPNRALWVRGLTDRLHAGELARLREAGYMIAPSRPVLVFDPTVPGWKMTRHLREDMNRARRVPGLQAFAGGPFAEADFAAMARLSDSATVERHSPLMPQYRAPFFQAAAAWDACRIVGLRNHAGALCGFATMIVGGGAMTCGTLGYDLADEQARRIYPALIALTMNEAIDARLPFNLGYGADDFKRRRGAVQAMEMNAFYLRHLGGLKRAAWEATLRAMAALAGPVMKRL